MAWLWLLVVFEAVEACSSWCDNTVSTMQQGNGICDFSCMTASCNWDGGDCLSACSCSILKDGTCDTACNTWQCGYDGGDCAVCKPGC
mmetsp:Transcript_2547/g.5819  ORF Transcript_2547/g.5819 Transcript_2547/m.5819 type:complete len:88 (-) Transcript_2547:628-891(-)